MVVERAEGNAFFVEELVGATAGTHDRGLPADLAEVLLVRLDRLDESARQVVRAASVAGRRVTHELLAVATDVGDAALDESLRTAVERNILVASDRHYAFRHALLGEAVYDDLLPGERVRLHAKYAAAIGDGRARGTAAELARHAKLAHDEKTALQASIQAGHEAAQVGGPDEAAQHFERALRLLAGLGAAGDGLVDRARLAVDTAEALSSSGHPERAAALLAEQLAALPDDASPTSRGALLAARAVALTAIETDEDPPAISAEAVRLTPEDDTLARARVLAAHAHVLAMSWRHQEAQQVGLEALALADQLHRSDLAAEVITTLSGLRLGTTKERLREALREAIDRTVETGAVHAELPRPLPAGPLLPGLGRARRGRALVPQRCRARRGRRHRVGPLRRRCPLAPHLGADDPRRLGRRAPADRPRRAATRRRWRARLRDPARRGPHRPRRGPHRRAARPAADVAARRRAGRARRCPGDRSWRPAGPTSPAPRRPTTTSSR